MNKCMNIAHRGASAYERENTLASIEKAIELGADMVEFDLRRTVDGKIVLWHDERIRNRAEKLLPISKISFDELAEFSRKGGYQLATFEEVLKSFGSRIAFDIEIKTPGFEEDVVYSLKRYPPVYPLMISSFHPGVIRKIKKLNCFVKTGLVIGNSRILKFDFITAVFFARYVMRSGADSVHLNLNIASPVLINDLTELGYEIYIWTVNDPEDMRNFRALKVDGIITDKPDLFDSVIRAGRDVGLKV